MAKQQADSEDALKRQARRRLIGAVALVTAVVVILPLVLDREPKPGGQNIDLRIPDKDRAGEFSSQMVLPEAGAASAPAAASVPAATTATAPVAQAVPSAAVQAQPVTAKPAPAQPAPAQAAAKPAPARAAPKTAPAPARPAPSQPGLKSGFAVQVGAFSNAASAREVQARLAKLGWHAYTEKAGGNIRVRVGNYPTRDAAEKVLKKLKAQGMHPAVVTVP